MNKVLNSFWSLLMIGALVVNTSCGKDEEEDVTPAAPTFSITGTGITDQTTITADVNQTVAFTVNVTAPGGFKSLVVGKTVGQGSSTEFDFKEKAAGQTITTYPYTFSYKPTSDEAGQAVTFKFSAEDDNGKQSEHTFVVNVNEPEILTYPVVLLGGKDNANVGSFYNAKDNKVYLMAAAKTNKDMVDFLYYYGASTTNSNAATIAAPTDTEARAFFGASNLDGMNNATNFVKTSANFANITKASDITNAWAVQKTSDPSTQIKTLQINDVFAFQLATTRGYRTGVAQVSKIEGTTGSRTITLIIKIQSTDI